MSSRQTSAKYWIPAALAVAALALTGCSGGKDASGKTGPEEGPLGKYMSALWGDEEFSQEQFEKDNLKVEELVAECMTKEGFEYTPNTNTGGVVMTSDEEGDDGPEYGSVEFAKEYGYGIIDFPGMSDMPEPEEEYTDPNQKYIESLSESEQEAFYETLSGPGPTEEEMAAMEAGEGYTSDWTREGCYGAANHEVQQDSGGVMAAYEDPEFTDLFDSMNEVWSVAYSEEADNPEIAKLNREWSDCIADAGHPDLTSPMAAQNALYEEYNELQSGGAEEPAEDSTGPSEKDLQAFKEREIELATADATCRADLKYDEKQQDVGFAAEQKFVDENKAALDALLAKHGAKKK